MCLGHIWCISQSGFTSVSTLVMQPQYAKEQRKLMNDRKNEWINEMMSGWKMKRWISVSLLFFWMNDWINEELNGIMNEWTNEWMTDWMIEWTSVHDEKIAPVP